MSEIHPSHILIGPPTSSRWMPLEGGACMGKLATSGLALEQHRSKPYMQSR